MSSEQIYAFISMYAPIVLMCIVFYFMLYRPQKAEQKKRREMLENLHKGNKIVTLGGIHGEIVEIRDNVLDLKVSDRVVIKVSRSAVSKNISQGREIITAEVDLAEQLDGKKDD